MYTTVRPVSVSRPDFRGLGLGLGLENYCLVSVSVLVSKIWFGLGLGLGLEACGLDYITGMHLTIFETKVKQKIIVVKGDV